MPGTRTSTLSNRDVVVFPASGHLDSLLSPCGLQISLDFLADPDQALDTSCAASDTIDFELPSKRKPWTAADQAQLLSALRRAPILPPVRERLASRRRPR